MNNLQLEKFDIIFPGHWISGPDRDWAFQTAHVLYLIENEFIRAVASYALFEPISVDRIRHFLEQTESKYERCLNSIYAQTFVFSLNGIRMLLKKLVSTLSPSAEVLQLISEYEMHFGHLEQIRDSAIHIEDRGRGVDKRGNRISSGLIVLGGFSERRFDYTGADGKIYSIDISEEILLSIHRILQSIISSYDWVETG